MIAVVSVSQPADGVVVELELSAGEGVKLTEGLGDAEALGSPWLGEGVVLVEGLEEAYEDGSEVAIGVGVVKAGVGEGVAEVGVGEGVELGNTLIAYLAAAIIIPFVRSIVGVTTSLPSSVTPSSKPLEGAGSLALIDFTRIWE